MKNTTDHSHPYSIRFCRDAIHLEIPIKWDRRTRRIALKYDRVSEFSLRVPYDLPLTFLQSFLDSHTRWIVSRYVKREIARTELAGPDEIIYGGKRLHIICKRESGVPWIRIDEANILVNDHDLNAKDLMQKLDDWMFAQAMVDLPRRLEHIADFMSIDYQRVSVRKQKSRWGSCSSRKTISLNWRLIQLRPDIADYVMIHELAHIVHMNHSKNFWDLVFRYCPDARALRCELRRLAHLLCGRGIENQFPGFELIPEMP